MKMKTNQRVAQPTQRVALFDACFFLFENHLIGGFFYEKLKGDPPCVL